MSSRISIPKLREYVATTISGEDILLLDPAEVRALLNAVEAARIFARHGGWLGLYLEDRFDFETASAQTD